MSKNTEEWQKARKVAILDALQRFVRQRPDLGSQNYGDWAMYRAEMRGITKDMHQAETLLAAVRWRDSITADNILAATEGGRLSVKLHWDVTPDGGTETLRKIVVDYCAGQSFSHEYRRAVCHVLSSTLWANVRDNAMPAPTYKQHGSATDLPMRTEAVYDGLSAGDWLRLYFRREFGRGIASRWFN